jgi:hypothetical protein
MTPLPYVLVVLFALGDGSIMTMQTMQSFTSPLNCSMRAFIETETAGARSQATYVCMAREKAAVFLDGQGRDPLAAKPAAPPPGMRQGRLE